MNRNNNTSSLTEAAMMTGILVIIAYLSNFIFTFLMFFYPVPVIILAKRRGMKYSTLSLVAADIIISMLLGIQTGVIFIILYTPFSLALAYGIYKDESPYKTVLFGSVAYMISFVMLIFLMQGIMGVSFVQELINMYNESFNIYNELLSNAPGGMDELNETLKNMENMKDQMITFVRELLPAIIVITSVTMAAVNYLIASKFAKRFSIEVRQLSGLGLFSFPRSFMVGMSVLLLLSYLLSFLNYNVVLIQQNIIFVIFIAMYVQGLSVLSFYLNKYIINKVIRLIMMIIVLLSAGFMQILAILGLADLIIDIRKIRHRKV